jgi:hypothetical protein
MNGVNWTPDQIWKYTGGSIASLGLNVGSYSVSDALTRETITIKVDSGASVPDGGLTALLLGLSSLALAGVRRLVA